VRQDATGERARVGWDADSAVTEPGNAPDREPRRRTAGGYRGEPCSRDSPREPSFTQRARGGQAFTRGLCDGAGRSEALRRRG
jgi:hypothetical protein